MPLVLPHLPDTWPLLMSLGSPLLKLLFASDFTTHARTDVHQERECIMCTNGVEPMHEGLIIPRRGRRVHPRRQHLTALHAESMFTSSCACTGAGHSMCSTLPSSFVMSCPSASCCPSPSCACSASASSACVASSGFSACLNKSVECV
jgi:hypothetical protein